jgi:hypothetical protein
MRTSEFEEREYEAPLYSQLQTSSRAVWAPGQVLEAHVGFDHALYTSNWRFWSMRGYPKPPAGVVLGNYPPAHWWNGSSLTRPLPDFSLNLFIQAKRPYVGSRATKALNSLGVTGPYWKFVVDPEQQLVLESLSKSVGTNALVVYACAAFDSASELLSHSRDGTIVNASTFPDAASLKGHGAWYYTAPGSAGIANPDPEWIQGAPLLERVRNLTRREANPTADKAEFGQNLEQLSGAVKEAVASQAVKDTGRAAVYFEALRDIDPFTHFDRPSILASELRSYLTVAMFASVYRLQWLVLAAGDA